MTVNLQKYEMLLEEHSCQTIIVIGLPLTVIQLKSNGNDELIRNPDWLKEIMLKMYTNEDIASGKIKVRKPQTGLDNIPVKQI